MSTSVRVKVCTRKWMKGMLLWSHHHFRHVTSEEAVACIDVTPSEFIDFKSMEDTD